MTRKRFILKAGVAGVQELQELQEFKSREPEARSQKSKGRDLPIL
jgi:hypothetical protein